MTYLDNYILEKRLKPKSEKAYRLAWKHYGNATNMTIDELINEAYQEEMDHVPHFQMKIKQHILDFREYLLDKNMKISTVNKNLELVIYTYNYMELWTPKYYKVKTTSKTSNVQIIKKDDIRLALDCSNNMMCKAAILFIFSSGCRLVDTVNISVQDFIDATYEYHHSDNIYDVYNRLQYKKDVIPSWYIQSIKTNKMYHTFSSPEATTHILLMLKPRLHKLTPSDKLFNVSERTIWSYFKTINTNMNWGNNGTYSYFRGHTLRKTFSTILEECGVDYNCRRLMLSHTIDTLDNTYVRYSTERLKKEYMKALPSLTLYGEVEVVTVTDNDVAELQSLRKDYQVLEEKIIALQELLSDRIKDDA